MRSGKQLQAAIVLAAVLPTLGALPGCSSNRGTQSTMQGKTYTPPGQGKQGAGARSNAPPSSAETTTGKPSAASDDGSQQAAQGQVVLNPGAPAAAKPGSSGTATQH